ncbi:MAG: HAD family phosphatase [Candidatus Liptonbacteria bacterium]|nr:HAD family phosphatase [Candidatus Liptonbacteria bacterium]
MIRAVIFDMNGVIVDDEHVHEHAFREVLEKHGAKLGHEEYLVFFGGRTDADGFRSFMEKHRLSLSLQSLLKEKADLYLDLFYKENRPFPGVIEAIKSLKKRFRLALASSATRREIDLVLKSYELEQYFELVLSAEDVKKGKPDPEPYRKTAEFLKIPPSDCAVIEDSRNGVLSAKAAGTRCIGITTSHDASDLREADVIIGNFRELTPELLLHMS